MAMHTPTAGQDTPLSAVPAILLVRGDQRAPFHQAAKARLFCAREPTARHARAFTHETPASDAPGAPGRFSAVQCRPDQRSTSG
jgi:hypothetical protein